MDRPLGPWLVALLVAASVVGTAGAIHEAGLPPQVEGSIDPDGVLLAVDLAADGSAVWRIEYRVRLDDENATEAFDSVRDEIAADPDSFTGPFAERMRPTVVAAQNSTGREMALDEVSVSAEVQQLPQPYGVVTYRFAWEGFAAVEGDRIRAGEAIAGLFLDGETRLLVTWPEGYRFVRATPEPDDRRNTSATWAGPLDFASDEPELVVTSSPVGTPGSSPPEQPTGDGAGQNDGIAWILAAGIVIVLVLGTGGWLLLRRSGDDQAPETSPPDELLSNEERVLRVLEEHGGRMKQQEVASALDWTDAKTSQVVGNLREAGDIESFRLGRENVLSLPGYDDD
ncbi:MAG: hypothetical protein R3324_14090 [Halobacteriales archaeon]|nr:hypothetical protein [Halobacteriales archaeon]